MASLRRVPTARRNHLTALATTLNAAESSSPTANLSTVPITVT